MSEKNSVERLFDLIGRTDGALLEEVYGIDSAEKLKNRTAAIRLSRTRRIKKIMIAAASLTVVASLVATALLMRPEREYSPKPEHADRGEYAETSIPTTSDKSEVIPAVVSINSVDALNYYSGKAVLLNGGANLSGGDSGGAVTALPMADTQKDTRTGTYPSEAIVYNIGRDALFEIESAMFCSITVVDEGGFLGSKVGAGSVDVMVTKNREEHLSMITFKNGDRYYSCFVNLWTQNRMEFSTHIYAEGFSVVKNFDKTVYKYTIFFDNDEIVDFKAEPDLSKSEGFPMVRDTVIFEKGSSAYSAMGGSFTAKELEELFTSKVRKNTSDGLPLRGKENQEMTLYRGKEYIYG
jgi:hypothetical protein